jgi:hypothetical protein
MDTLTRVQLELFERVTWEMSMNLDVLEYHLKRVVVVNDPVLQQFKQRLIGIVNAIEDNTLPQLDTVL